MNDIEIWLRGKRNDTKPEPASILRDRTPSQGQRPPASITDSLPPIIDHRQLTTNSSNPQTGMPHMPQQTQLPLPAPPAAETTVASAPLKPFSPPNHSQQTRPFAQGSLLGASPILATRPRPITKIYSPGEWVRWATNKADYGTRGVYEAEILSRGNNAREVLEMWSGEGGLSMRTREIA